jgi:hypothetical protein
MRSRNSKLSRLQKAILLLALDNKEREGRGLDQAGRCDVFYAEILHSIFHFPTKKPYQLSPRQLPCNRIFSPEAIGRSRYHTAETSCAPQKLRSSASPSKIKKLGLRRNIL